MMTLDSAKIRLRLCRSALNCDLRDLKEKGRISGFVKHCDEWNEEWIDKQKRRVNELETIVKELENETISPISIQKV